MSKEYTRLYSFLGDLSPLSRVHFLDNFDNIQRFTITGTAGDYIGELDPTVSFNGPQSLHLKSRATGAAENDYIQAQISMFYPPARQISIEGILKWITTSPIHSIAITPYLYDHVNKIWPAFCIHFAGDYLGYHSALDAYTEIPGSDSQFIENAWHHFRLTFNYLTLKYISLQFDNQIFDLSTLDIPYDPLVVERSFQIALYAYTVGAAPVDIYLNNLAIHTY